MRCTTGRSLSVLAFLSLSDEIENTRLGFGSQHDLCSANDLYDALEGTRDLECVLLLHDVWSFGACIGASIRVCAFGWGEFEHLTACLTPHDGGTVA